MFNSTDSISPATFAECSVLAKECAQQMLDRLSFINLQPAVIVDVGSGVGAWISLLKECYPQAQVIGVEANTDFLQYAKSLSSHSEWICANPMTLPLIDHSVDLIFANLVLPGCPSLEKCLQEWLRVLRPEGLLMFSSLGPDTLQAWRDTFTPLQWPHFLDMHDVGDALKQNLFVDPVLDLEYVTLTYHSIEKLLDELQITGMLHHPESEQIESAKKIAPAHTGLYSTVYEIVYGHAFAPISLEFRADEAGMVKIPLSHLRRRLY